MRARGWREWAAWSHMLQCRGLFRRGSWNSSWTVHWHHSGRPGTSEASWQAPARTRGEPLDTRRVISEAREHGTCTSFRLGNPTIELLEARTATEVRRAGPLRDRSFPIKPCSFWRHPAESPDAARPDGPGLGVDAPLQRSANYVLEPLLEHVGPELDLRTHGSKRASQPTMAMLGYLVVRVLAEPPVVEAQHRDPGCAGEPEQAAVVELRLGEALPATTRLPR